MPRRTAKSKAKNSNVKVKSNCVSIKTIETKNDIAKDKGPKELFVEKTEETVVEVYHRKSERRRTARDIFLVFEEESTSKRRTRGSNKKQTKPKFGHLKVEDHKKTKGLLRDIKNEPRCYLSGSSLNVNTSVPPVPILKSDSNILNVVNKEKKPKSGKNKTITCKSITPAFKSNNIKSLQISSVGTPPYTIDNEPRIVPRVNPIFLWVKQDDTRIVEVRCEDYDKRNRIRITKTSNGWRAIPRSDPTSSKVLKFYPTPLMKVKRENISEPNNNTINSQIKYKQPVVYNDYATQNISSSENVSNKIDSKFNEVVAEYIPIDDNTCYKYKNKKKKSKKLRKKLYSEKESKKEDIHIHNLKKNYIENKVNSVNTAAVINASLEIESTYQKESENEVIFHLCPKTGLFLPNNEVSIVEYEVDVYNDNEIITSKQMDSNLEKNTEEPKNQMPEDNTESLDAKTKNLKDLLDDADLLQHCDDNANSDSDLIDTLVKTSCENNLIQANEIISKSSIDALHQKALHDTNEMVVQLITDVSDPPKCLSFNEAGEIEGLNGELFQPNTYIETFDKQTSTEQQITLHSTTSVIAPSELPQTSRCENVEHIENMDINNSNERSVNFVEDSPKDLSYKKREEVCPPSESRSQCAVTSSSDVIKSPQREDSASLTSSSETLKNLILEQFIKLNGLSSQHQRDPIDLGKQRHPDLSNIKSIYASNLRCTNDFIETVVIEDEDDNDNIDHEEPLKKRLRLNKSKSAAQNVSKMVIIDKDPDPLTQLRLLIRNTQWKVPDPILVPKDRLSAVLASPAREIPLLITTRPELRLPEAFAYPEIIQNPNILVISMAQLETILKNESKKTANSTVVEHDINEQLPVDEMSDRITNPVINMQTQSPKQNLTHKPTTTLSPNNKKALNNQIKETSSTSDPLSAKRKENVKCSQTDSSLSSDLNTATMAVLNQMLWLPYFGQISQDIIKSLKNPNLFPFLNSQLNNFTNMKDVYKKNNNIGQSSSQGDLQTIQHKLENNEESSVFQKIVEHQMQSVLQKNQCKADSSHLTAPAAFLNGQSTVDKSNSNNIELSNFIEQKKQKLLTPNNKQLKSPTVCRDQVNNSIENTLTTEKSYNLRSTVAGRHSTESKQYSSCNQRPNTDNKPRLTCKSLSNLLNPEHSIVPSSSSNPYVQNSSTDFLNSVNELKKNVKDCKKFETKGNILKDTTVVPSSIKTCGNANVSTESSSVTSESNSSNNDASTDTNIPLWHPLFGSNTKSAYSSPWQWTTVTASGE